MVLVAKIMLDGHRETIRICWIIAALENPISCPLDYSWSGSLDGGAFGSGYVHAGVNNILKSHPTIAII
jgi:hypothetical protein